MDAQSGHFWVFGYGSLMWNPGFEHDEAVPAVLGGLHRAPCIYSWVHRGTRKFPGIVLGLDKGGSCRGIAYRIPDRLKPRTLDYLRARELVTNVYRETHRKARLQSGETIPCITYQVRRNHEQYAGKVPHEALVARISRAEGKSGPNDEYFISTVRHMKEMGIRDRAMERLVAELQH